MDAAITFSKQGESHLLYSDSSDESRHMQFKWPDISLSFRVTFDTFGGLLLAWQLNAREVFLGKAMDNPSRALNVIAAPAVLQVRRAGMSKA